MCPESIPHEPDQSVLGSRLHEARKAAGYTQEQVAAELGTGFSVVSLYRWEHEKDQPSIQKVVRLAELYGVSIDWLCGRTTIQQVFVAGKMAVNLPVFEALKHLAEDGGRLEDVPRHLVRELHIDYAWRVPGSATLFDGDAADAIEREMKGLLQQLRGRRR